MGIRPVMNGAQFQMGKLQLEIRTECQVDFQIYFAVPQVLIWKNDKEEFTDEQDEHLPLENMNLPDGYTGLSNDLDLLRLYGNSCTPAYGPGNKLVTNNIYQEFPKNTNAKRKRSVDLDDDPPILEEILRP
ncbi:hypothetical protein BLOT_015677 [Blomia tropicalis]|nr:hypothetical protein BLOT_015677 [Blomia tropicalis]